MKESAHRSLYSGREMLAVSASRLVVPDDVVLVGLGLPQMAALLAQRTRTPNVTLLLEIGVFEPQVRRATVGIADPRMWEGATSFGGMLDVLGYMLHSGRVSLGLLGALQVDPYGSINSTMVRGADGAERRFLGSGGANDIASAAGRVVCLLQHEGRKFRQTVDFLTSPGHRLHGHSRSEVGLPGPGTTNLVTDRALIDITDGGAILKSVHPGESPQQVIADTPFALHLPREGVTVTPPPTEQELHLLRSQLDPEGWYTR